MELEYYRLQRVSSGAIAVSEEKDAYVTSPTAAGTGAAEEARAPLSELIERLNDRFGTDFNDEERFSFEQGKERAVGDEEVRSPASANPSDKSRSAPTRLSGGS